MTGTTAPDEGPDPSDIAARIAWLRTQLELADQYEARLRETISTAETELSLLRARRPYAESELNALLAAQAASVPVMAAPTARATAGGAAYANPAAGPTTGWPPSGPQVGGTGPGPGGAPQPWRDPRQPETSTRTVQNVLFVLGGLLLGTAAVAFTAVAWATFGELGRALVLAAVTLIMLSVPLIALWRGLVATAETFAAVGLLLLLLDGYALWYINVAGVQSMPVARYAGLVALVTAAVAAAYRLRTRLVGPGFPALVLLQPVLPLLLRPERPGVWAVSLIASAVAAIDALVVAALVRAHARRPRPSQVALRSLTWILFGFWTAVAFIEALVAEFGRVGGPVPGVGDRAWAGVALVVAAAVLLGAALIERRPMFLAPAAATLVIAAATAVGFVLATAQPPHALLLVSGVAAVTSTVVAPLAPLLPRAVRPGLRAGALIVAGGVLLAVAGFALLAAAATVLRLLFPFWAADLQPTGPNPPALTWELPVAAVLVCVGLAVVARPRSRVALVALGGLFAILAVPASLPLPWWAPAPIALAAATLALAASLAGRTEWATVGAAVSAAVLTIFALLTSAARPGLTAAVLAALAVVGIAAAAVGARRPRGGVDRVTVAATALAVGLLAVPPALGSALAAAHAPAWWAARAMVIGLVPLLVILAAVSRLSRREHGWPDRMPTYGFAGLAIAAVIWPAVAASVGAESRAVYSALSVLAIALGRLAVGTPPTPRPSTVEASRPSTVDTDVADAPDAAGSTDAVAAGPRPTPPAPVVAMTMDGAALVAALPGLIGLALTVAPAVLGVVGAPYAWLGSIWSGRPPGVGLVPPGPSDVPPVTMADAAALAILAVAGVAAAYRLTGRVLPALAGLGIGGPTAVLVALTAAGAPWPCLPAASLLLGVLLVLLAGAAPMRPGRSAIAAGQGLIYVGAGMAGSLSLRWTTLTSLAVVLVAAAVLGAVGRDQPWRVAGWVASGAAALTLAAAGGFAADLQARQVGFAVLGAAVLVLFGGVAVGTGPRRDAEGRALHALAQAGGLVALLFTVGFPGYAAAVSVLWGIAVGLRALVPGTGRTQRAVLAAVAGGYELVAWWLLLSDRGVTLIEAYTLPLALVALLAGWAALRARPDLRSWVAYGPALAAGFLPSLAAIIGVPGEPWRRLALGAAAIAVLVLGSLARRQAPVVIGGGVLALVALHELVLLWQRLPGWIPLAVGGAVLVGLAITYERRLRDLRRLRSALGRMT